jgi:hypothetical protein
MTTKEVFVSRTRDFLNEIARLNKKAARIGVSAIQFEDLGKVTKTRHIISKDEDGNEDVRTVPMDVQRYSLSLPEPADCQWVAIVKITPMDNGEAFVEAMPAGTSADVDAWKNADAKNCDHCHTHRARAISYVVRHKTDGRVLQLGRNCFGDYIGKDTLAALEFQSVIMQMFGGEDGFWPMEAGGMRSVPVAKVVDCVLFAEVLRRTEGWKNNVRNPLDGGLEVEGTHRIAGDCIKSWQVSRGGDNSPRVKNLLAAVTDADRAAAAAIVARMQDEPVSDEFGETLKNLSDYEWIPSRKANLAAYMGQFLHNVDRKANEARLNATRVYVGTVGQRELFENLTCVRCSAIDTDFGTLYINAFNDQNGNVLVWKTGSVNFAEGDKVTLIGTVKEHSDYRGTKQTILSRCKELDEAAVAKAKAKAARAAAKIERQSTAAV